MSRCTNESADLPGACASTAPERYNALFCSDSRVHHDRQSLLPRTIMDDKTERTRLRASLARDKPALLIYGLLALVALVGLLLSL